MEDKMKTDKIKVRDLNLFYGDFQALKEISISFAENSVAALIGPSGCGKSTFLRTLNRMNDLIENVTINGTVIVDEQSIYDKGLMSSTLESGLECCSKSPILSPYLSMT